MKASHSPALIFKCRCTDAMSRPVGVRVDGCVGVEWPVNPVRLPTRPRCGCWVEEASLLSHRKQWTERYHQHHTRAER